MFRSSKVSKKSEKYYIATGYFYNIQWLPDLFVEIFKELKTSSLKCTE